MTTGSMLPVSDAGRLARSGVVAVVTVKNPDDAGPIARARLDGGVGAIELTFRTARGALWRRSVSLPPASSAGEIAPTGRCHRR